MSHHDDESKKKENNDSVVKPDPETLHTTDPQKNMEGPISSLMHKTGKSLDTEETKEEADKEKDED
ncbi:MAG: hypothetical protein WKF35_03730 [Ferruginibacter sp.]